MGRSTVTPAQAEQVLNFVEAIAHLAQLGHVRHLLLTSDPERRIVVETVYPMQGLGWLDFQVKDRAGEEFKPLLAAWAEVEQVYFTARDPETDKLYVHTAAVNEPWLIEGLPATLDIGVERPKTPPRTEAEQIAEGLEHAEALVDWQLHDDHVIAAKMAAEVPKCLAFVDEARGQLRWAMREVSDN